MGDVLLLHYETFVLFFVRFFRLTVFQVSTYVCRIIQNTQHQTYSLDMFQVGYKMRFYSVKIRYLMGTLH